MVNPVGTRLVQRILSALRHNWLLVLLVFLSIIIFPVSVSATAATAWLPPSSLLGRFQRVQLIQGQPTPGGCRFALHGQGDAISHTWETGTQLEFDPVSCQMVV